LSVFAIFITTPSAGEIIRSLSAGQTLSGSLKKLRTRKEIIREIKERISNRKRAKTKVTKKENKI